MKYFRLLIYITIFPLSIFAQDIDSENNDFHDIKGIVLEKLTWSLSRRNYYVPLYVRCNDSSDVQLILATSWDLYCNYQYRYSVSDEDFLQLLKKTIDQNDTLQGICIEDFENLYDSYKSLFRGITFVSKVNKYNCKYLNYDKDVLLNDYFDKLKHYKGNMRILPLIACRLKEFGILLIYTNEGISFYDVSCNYQGDRIKRN